MIVLYFTTLLILLTIVTDLHTNVNSSLLTHDTAILPVCEKHDISPQAIIGDFSMKRILATSGIGYLRHFINYSGNNVYFKVIRFVEVVIKTIC